MPALAAGPGTAGGSASAALKGALHGAFSGRPLPVVATGEAVMPGASMWAGSRLWVDEFRRAGLGRGQRLVLALPASPGFVQVLIAALWEGLTLAPVPSDVGVGAVMARIGAAAAVTTPRAATPGGWIADPAGAPIRRVLADPARLGASESTADGAALLFGAHSAGEPTAVSRDALAERVAAADDREAAPRVRLDRPWHEPETLLDELLPALLTGAEIRSRPGAIFDGNGAAS